MRSLPTKHGKEKAHKLQDCVRMSDIPAIKTCPEISKAVVNSETFSAAGYSAVKMSEEDDEQMVTKTFKFVGGASHGNRDLRERIRLSYFP